MSSDRKSIASGVYNPHAASQQNERTTVQLRIPVDPGILLNPSRLELGWLGPAIRISQSGHLYSLATRGPVPRSATRGSAWAELRSCLPERERERGFWEIGTGELPQL